MKDLLDDIDLKIIYLLCKDARMSYRTIGFDIGLSSKSVKARFYSMISRRFIESFHMIVNPAALGYHKICFLKGRYGNNINQNELIKVLNSLGNLMFHIEHLGRGFSYGISIKNKSDDEIKSLIDPLGSAVISRTFQIIPNSHHDLTETDLKIIKCLLSNPRMEVSDISSQISMSTKTVTRCLDRMKQNHILLFSIVCDFASAAGFMLFALTVYVQESLYHDIYDRINSEFHQNVLCTPQVHTSSHDEIRIILFSANILTIESILVKVESIKGVKSTELDIVIKTKHYTNWMVREIDQRLTSTRTSLP